MKKKVTEIIIRSWTSSDGVQRYDVRVNGEDMDVGRMERGEDNTLTFPLLLKHIALNWRKAWRIGHGMKDF
tara:strand:+ start:493 stop:705 length:213 start_codon:yes stop_codon:yes gene_type:complete